MTSAHISAVVAGAALATWSYLLFGRGYFWRIGSMVAPTAKEETPAKIVAVIAARNEEDVISRSLESLLALPASQLLHVFLVDDHSTDATSYIAAQPAERFGQKERLTVIQSALLPAGWLGKLWAMQQGIDRALAFSPEFLLLTDADIVHAPGSLAGLVWIAREQSRDLVSAMVRLQCETLAEKLLIPAFVFFFFKLYPPQWVGDGRKRTAGAAGGCILIRPEALARAGGVAGIRNEIIDDCALARAVKQSGGKLWLGLAPDSFSIRPYPSFTEIRRMIARTAFNQLQHSALMLLSAIAGMTLTYMLPLALLLAPGIAAKMLAAATVAVMLWAYQPMVRFYRLNPVWSLALPLAALFYTGATLQSAMNYWRGQGGEWKGRHQDRSAVA